MNVQSNFKCKFKLFVTQLVTFNNSLMESKVTPFSLFQFRLSRIEDRLLFEDFFVLIRSLHFWLLRVSSMI